MSDTKQHVSSFGDHFYGAAGFRVLINRAEAGRETLKQISSYLSGRVSTEESYAKAMIALNKGAEKDKDKDETMQDPTDFGSFLDAFRTIRAEAEYMGRQHHQFQAIIAKSMQVRITELESRQHKAQTKLVSNTQKVMHEMTGLKKQYRKLHDRYLKGMYKAEQATRAQKQNLDPNVAPKLEAETAAAKKSSDAATEEYRDIVARIRTYQGVYDDALTTALQEFQTMEEERITVIKEVIGQYKDFHQILQVGMKDSCDRIGESVDNIDDKTDLYIFMQKKGTGNERGIPIEFEEYTEEAYLATLSKSGLRAATIVQSDAAMSRSNNEKAGYLRKRGHVVKNWKQRYFKLVGSALYYYSDDESQDPIQGIPLMGASVEVADNLVKKGELNSCFCVDTHQKKYYMKADNPSEMQEWISAIHQAQGRTEGWQRGTDRVRKLDPKTGSSAASSMPTVISIHAFAGTAENGELAFEEGEIITVVSVEDPNWWEGKIGADRTGIFPSNYVKIYVGGEGGAAPVESVPVQPEVQTPAEQVPVQAQVQYNAQQVQVVAVPQPIAEDQGGMDMEGAAGGGGGISYRALWDFEGSEEGELPFRSGDVIQVTNQDDEGWWYGVFNGVEGMFPANYVEQC